MIPLFVGFDPREEAGTHVFNSSVIQRATEQVTIAPLDLKMLSKCYQSTARDGSNAFIYSRFLVPFLMGYRGTAIFADGADMLCRADIAELWALRDPYKAVQVVKHDYKTSADRKYLGTLMEAPNADYPRKNWSSLMIVNCAHYAWRDITPDRVSTLPGSYLHRFEFIPDRFIGELPKEWNWLDEYGFNPEAKIVHWTLGTPAFPMYRNAPHAAEFREQLQHVNHVTA